jgi:hypothetical protein
MYPAALRSLTKAAAFLAAFQTAWWAVNHPLHDRLHQPIDMALGSPAGYSFASAVVLALFAVVLTVAFRRLDPVNAVFGAASGKGFWKGLACGLLPAQGVILCGVLLGYAGLASDGSGAYWALGTMVWSITPALLVIGYPLPALLRHLRPAVAIPLVVLAANVYLMIEIATSSSRLLRLVAQPPFLLTGALVAIAFVWSRGLRLPLGLSLGLSFIEQMGLFPVDWTCGAAIPGTVALIISAVFLARRKTSQEPRISKGFFLTAWTGGLGVLVLLAAADTKGVLAGGDVAFLGGLVALLFAMISFPVLIYKMWKAIQNSYARTSPGRAVALCFSPFYNLYWMFQVLPGFVSDYNAYAQRVNAPVRPLRPGLFVAFCVLGVCSAIPLVGLFAIIANFVVGSLMISRICDAVNALPERPVEMLARAPQAVIGLHLA